MPFDNTPTDIETRSEASQHLLRAIDLIADPKNWNKGEMRKLRRRPYCSAYCALGAVEYCGPNVVLHAMPPGLRVMRNNMMITIRIALDESAVQKGFADIVAMNDAPATTHADILAVMREAADDLR